MFTMKREFITPDKARQLTEKAKINRRIKPWRVEAFSREMQHGKWNYGNNDTPVGCLTLNGDGTVLDGHHRLLALAQSGTKGQWFAIKRGAQTENALLEDSGTSKSYADRIRMYCQIKGRPIPSYMTELCQAITIYVWHIMPDANRSYAKPILTATEQIEAFVKYGKRLHAYIEKVHAIRPIMSVGAAGALWALFADRDSDEADTFFHKLESGKHIKDGEPVGVLRNRLIVDRADSRVSSGTHVRDVIERCIRAWNATRDGKRWTRVESNSGEYPEIR